MSRVKFGQTTYVTSFHKLWPHLMFSLNSQEKKVLIFIAIAALIGIGLKFYQKHIGSTPKISDLNTATYNQASKININTASEEDLIKIPGIGPEFASRIIEYRQTQGPFSDIEDLKKVKGIGEKKFEAIKEFITLGELK